MLVRHSCTIRKIAISISCGNRPKSDGILKSTLILLRSENPSTYQRNADPRPASSSKGGCSRCEIVRICLSISSTSAMVSATALAPFASSLSDCFLTVPRFMLIAATSCPTLSCISRAIRRRSSSCTCNSRAERLRKVTSALFGSSSIRRLGMSEKRSICKQVKLRFLPYGTLGEVEQRLPVPLLSCMVCPAAQALFEDYAKAAMEHFEATAKLANLVGQHGQFEEQKECVERVHEKCSDARLALEQHWAQHSCR